MKIPGISADNGLVVLKEIWNDRDYLYPTPTGEEIRNALRSAGYSMIAADNAQLLYESVPLLIAEIEKLLQENKG